MDETHSPLTESPATSRGRPAPARDAGLILALALTLNLVGNDRVGLWDRDEPRYACCTREMRERGDWLHPTFNGRPRYHKPILVYWLMRAGFAVGGDNPFGARLVSAFAGAGTCLLAWRLGRSIAGPEVGLLAGLMLACAPIVVVESKLATTDATLALLVVAAQSCLWGLSRRDSAGLALGFWASMALATLLKGPVGPALVAASGVASWWWGGPTACWARLRWKVGFVLFMAIAAPWYLAIGVESGGEFFRFGFQTQIVRRLASGLEDHGGFPGYYAVAAIGAFYPWSTLLPAAMASAWGRRKSHPAFGFLLGWAVGPWLVLECFRTKLVHYYLPAFPACGLLAAWLAVEASRRGVAPGLRRLERAGVRVFGFLGFVSAAGLLVGSIFLPASLKAPGLAMGLVLGVGTLLGRVRLADGRTLPASRAMVATWSGVMLLFAGWFVPAAEPYRFSRVVGERLAELSARVGVRPAMMTFQEPGLVYALGHPACDVRGYDEMADEVRRGGPILVPLLPSEVEEMRRDDRFSIRVVEPIGGFNSNKGKYQELEFAVVGASSISISSRMARSGEEPLVK